MKRLFIILFSTLLLASCQKDNAVDGGSASTLTYSLSTDVQFHVKSGESAAAGNASEINVLWYGVYHKKADGSYRYMSDMSAFVEVTDPNSIKVPITLINGQEYELVFVAQHRIESPDDEYAYMYTISEEAVMTRNTSTPVTSGEELDVFVFVDKVGPVVGNTSKNITLERPVAQINIATSQTSLPADIDITLSSVSASYNLIEHTFSSETTTLTFNDIVPTGQTVTVNSTNYKGLTTLYILGGNNVNMQISCDGNSRVINNIAIAENYKTNIVGNI